MNCWVCLDFPTLSGWVRTQLYPAPHPCHKPCTAACYFVQGEANGKKANQVQLQTVHYYFFKCALGLPRKVVFKMVCWNCIRRQLRIYRWESLCALTKVTDWV